MSKNSRFEKRLSTVRVLEVLRGLMKRRWTRGTFRDENGDVCLMGGIDEAIARLRGTGLFVRNGHLSRGQVEGLGYEGYGFVKNPKTPASFATNAAQYILMAANQLPNGRRYPSVVHFNDSYDTNRRLVLKVVDKAIALAKRRHHP